MGLRVRRPRLFCLSSRAFFLGLASLVGVGLTVQPAMAQMIIGGRGAPAVMVDNSVLDRLGAAPTLPQLFLEQRHPGTIARAAATRPYAAPNAYRPPSYASAAPTRRHRTTRVARTQRARSPIQVASAEPVRQKSSLNSIIHLIPPGSQTPPPPQTQIATLKPPVVARQEVAMAEPTKPSVAALVPPNSSPLPGPRQSNAVPTAPIVPAAPSRDDQPVTAPTQPPAAKVETPPVATTAPPAPVVAPKAPEPTPVVASAPPIAAPKAPEPTPPPVIAAAPPKMPDPTPAAPTPAAPVRVASAASAGSNLNAIDFSAGTTELPTSAKPALDAVAAKLATNDAMRVQVVAHATGGSDQAIEARRVSLARAVAVRGYLIEKGVRSLRIDVRALGNRADDAPAGDQVDLVLVNQ